MLIRCSSGSLWNFITPPLDIWPRNHSPPRRSRCCCFGPRVCLKLRPGFVSRIRAGIPRCSTAVALVNAKAKAIVTEYTLIN